MRDRAVWNLFLVSWLVLFLELACIRWFPSHVLFLTFFTNTVLLACFVGMSIGCLVARRPTRYLTHTPVWLLAAIGAGLLVDRYSPVLQYIFDVGNQANPDVVYFGTEEPVREPPSFTIPIEFVAALFFVLIAGVMVGPGQEMGRAFNRVADRTAAYSANLLGSLVGIGMFALCARLRLPPIVWFGLAAIVTAYFLLGDEDQGANTPRSPSRLLLLLALGAALALTAVTSGFSRGPFGKQTIWSPYYRIDYYEALGGIRTNKISHQLMEAVDQPGTSPYALPYLFQRDLKDATGKPAWQPFKRVLIIGAGSGNDVARALRWLPDDARIDAVEIDPVIQQIGEKHHPNRPFQDPRVERTIYLNDGRNFLRESPPETYDLVIFALIDSLVLQSSQSGGLRLESYLFTYESFRDVRRVLKPTGLYAVYNFFRQGWIVCRIRDQLRRAFDGSDPVVMDTSVHRLPEAEIGPEWSDPDAVTVYFSGSPAVLDPLRAPFRQPDVRYWYPWIAGVPRDTEARFGTKPPDAPPPALVKQDTPPRWYPLRVTAVAEVPGLEQATDDWPFVYTRVPAIPGLTWRGVGLTLVLSVLLWFAFGGHRALSAEGGAAPEWGTMLRSFCLGAGFMLVETKAVVQMALLFGGTWMVNTVVFAAILVMALAGNLYAGWVKPKRLEPYYVGLFVTLGLGLAISPSFFLGWNPALQIVAVCALVFAPIAFAGVVFATTFRRTTQPDRVFGANVAGALVGGLAENASVVLGFQLLLCVAVGFYLLSALFGNRRVPTGAAEGGV
jgi:hypothetical protein